MTYLRTACVLFSAALCAAVPPAAFADEDVATGEPAAAAMTEKEKIEALISIVENLEGATFIRNGDEHTCADAAEHMRRKWKWKGDDIETARDFIQVAAAKSSTSGKAYVIRFEDGKEVTSEVFLTAELDKLEKPTDEGAEEAKEEEVEKAQEGAEDGADEDEGARESGKA